MRLLSASIVHGLGFLREAQWNPRAINPTKVASFVLDIARKDKPRKLWDEFGYDEENEDLGPGDFSDAGDSFPPELAECGIDANKILGGLLTGDFPDSLNGSFDPDEIPPDILTIFAEDGEEDCTAKQEAKFMDAVETFGSCTGWGKFFEDEEALDELADELAEKCGPFVPESPFDVGGIDFNDMDQCVDTVLGDNPLGGFLRDNYHSPDKNFACVAAFGDAVPSCLIHLSDLEVVVPGSLFKKAACLLGKFFSAIEEACLGELQALNKCLPPLGAGKSCFQVGFDCEMEEAVSLLIPPKLTTGRLPDTCLRVYEENKLTDEKIPERFSKIYHQCEADGAEANFAAQTEATQARSGSKPTESKSNKQSATVHLPRDAQDDKGNSAILKEPNKITPAVLGVALAAVVGIIAVVFASVKKIQANGRDDSDPSKNNFTQLPVINSEGLDDNLVASAVPVSMT